jgi:hypothetical protein
MVYVLGRHTGGENSAGFPQTNAFAAATTSSTTTTAYVDSTATAPPSDTALPDVTMAPAPVVTTPPPVHVEAPQVIEVVLAWHLANSESSDARSCAVGLSHAKPVGISDIKVVPQDVGPRINVGVFSHSS